MGQKEQITKCPGKSIVSFPLAVLFLLKKPRGIRKKNWFIKNLLIIDLNKQKCLKVIVFCHTKAII